MKKATRLYLTGSIQGMFYRQFVKQNAQELDVKGFIRKLEDNRIEIFLEGQGEDVEQMVAICSRGPKHAIIRNIEQKEERLQDFKEFKILNF